MQHRHAPLGLLAQHLANAVFQHTHLDELVLLGHAAALHEVAQGRRRIAAPAHAGDGGHAGVVPAADHAVGDHHPELALARDGVGEIQARELDLPGTVRRPELVEKPVVQRTVILELERAQRVRDVLERIRQRMREIVHRVDAPFVAGPLVRDVADAVQGRVAQVHVGRCHVDLRPQHVFAVPEFARAHAPEQVHILRDAAITIRAVRAGLGQGSAVRANFLGTQRVHVRESHFNEFFGRLVQLLEIVRRVRQAVSPVETEPVHVLLDGVDVFLLFLVGIGVVIPQVGTSARLGGDAEIQAYRHDVADVQIAVGLRRKPRNDFVVLAGLEVVMDDLADKVPRRFAHRFNSLFWTGRYCTRSRGPA